VTTYPYGYAADASGVQGMGTMLTMEQYRAKKTVYQLNSEFWRRYSALMEYGAASGVPLGTGTGWRVQPSPPPTGFAAPGNSNHEGFPADGVSGGAVAIDAVPNISWPWMEKNLAAYGLRSFKYINNEPWHVQPVEIPASRRWRTEPWILPPFTLPGHAPHPPEVLATPPGSPSFRKGATDSSTKMSGAPDGRVTWLQTILRDEYVFTIVPDGQFGTKTDAALRVMQLALNVTVDGIYGNQTAAARYAKVGK